MNLLVTKTLDFVSPYQHRGNNNSNTAHIALPRVLLSMKTQNSQRRKAFSASVRRKKKQLNLSTTVAITQGTTGTATTIMKGTGATTPRQARPVPTTTAKVHTLRQCHHQHMQGGMGTEEVTRSIKFARPICR
eukprot:TRINITY_DN342_c0_g1_i1.p3 TRINITY_DN342_c0_g1~~TRINITY_DN342_c0_g1_i1.p3  ORF type:complete len:133 (+),score=12.47 TRINITY_DN342_c0_g1_i1:513-911(+)